MVPQLLLSDPIKISFYMFLQLLYFKKQNTPSPLILLAKACSQVETDGPTFTEILSRAPLCQPHRSLPLQSTMVFFRSKLPPNWEMYLSFFSRDKPMVKLAVWRGLEVFPLNQSNANLHQFTQVCTDDRYVHSI